MLTPSQILTIRNSKASLAKLALKYGVSKSTIANIKAGRTHRDPSRCPTCQRPFDQYRLSGEAPENAP